MKHIIALILFFLFSSFVFAQVPNEIKGINYQGIVRESDGSPITFTNVEIKIGIYNLSNTSPIFEETHTVTTNEFGLFNLIIGTGTINTGNILTSSLWSEAVEIKTEADYGSGYDEIGTVDLAAVPYAFKAKYEGQKIDFNTTSGYLRISDGTIDANNNPVFIDSTQISVSGGGTDDQEIIDFELTSTNMLNIEIEDGNTRSVDLSDLIDDSDADPTNEIQDLSLNSSTNILTITNNSGATNIDLTPYIELPTTATTGQVLTWNGSAWIAQNSGTGADNWGTQVVNTSGGNITGDGTSGSPLTVTDGDSDATNEIELPTGGTNGQILSTDGSGNYTWINDNNIDLDNDPNNEIELPPTASTGQVLTWNGSNWVAQNAPSGADNWGTQSIVIGSGLSGDGTSGSPLVNTFTEIDGDSSNELQTISKSGSTVTLSNGGGTFTDDDTQLTESQVDTYVSNNGYLTSFSEVDGDITNEIQTLSISGTSLSLSSGGGSVTLPTGTDSQDLSLTGNSLSLTNDGSPVDLSGYLDNTDSQSLSISGSNLSISGGNSVDLSSFSNHDWYEANGTTSPNNINDNIYTLGRVGIGVNNPGYKVDIQNGANSVINLKSTVNGNAQIFVDGMVGNSLINFKINGGNVGLVGANSTYTFLGDGSGTSLVSRNGDIGIGTTSPIRPVDLVTNSYGFSQVNTAGNVRMGTYIGNSYTPSNIPGGSIGTETDNPFFIYVNNNGDKFYVGNSSQNYNVGIGTNTPSTKLEVNGIITIDDSADPNELHRASTNDANLVPVAYGRINSDGTIRTGATTDNITGVSWSGSQYVISIAGTSFNINSFNAFITPVGSPIAVSASSVGGNLLVRFSGNAQSQFNFIIYKK